MGDPGLSQFRLRPQPASAGFPGSFGMEVEGDLVVMEVKDGLIPPIMLMPILLESEELPLERRRDSV